MTKPRQRGPWTGDHDHDPPHAGAQERIAPPIAALSLITVPIVAVPTGAVRSRRVRYRV